MSSLPQKSIKGAVFKTWAIQSIDKLIDYLSGTFIRGGKGISVRRSAGVTIIELEKQPEQVQQNATGGATQDISANVSGGTASVTLSGSTSSVEFVGTGDVTISGNTNGQIEINSNGVGMSFPDWGNLAVHQISLTWSTGNPMTATYEVPQNAWLKIDLQLGFYLFSSVGWSGVMEFTIKADNREIFWYNKRLESPDEVRIGLDDFFSQLIPVKAGQTLTFKFSHSGGTSLAPNPSAFYLYY